MKKIMFKDKYGFTQAVLERRKTQTRRAVTKYLFDKYSHDGHFNPKDIIDHAPYKIGETVAIAQPYSKTLWLNPEAEIKERDRWVMVKDHKGWHNKMFVCADLMSHYIKITNIRLQQVGDVTDEDAIKEGAKICGDKYYGKDSYGFDGFNDRYYPHPQYAYIGLVERMGMRPSDWVFVYDFELVD